MTETGDSPVKQFDQLEVNQMKPGLMALARVMAIGAGALVLWRRSVADKKGPPPIAKSEYENFVDHDHHRVMVGRINRNGPIDDPNTPRPLLTLEEFFEGNDDPGSIGAALENPPTPKAFYEMLKSIRNRPIVNNVLVEIKDHEETEGWPTSERVWIITSATDDVVSNWFIERYRPTGILASFPPESNIEQFEIPNKMQAIGIEWSE